MIYFVNTILLVLFTLCAAFPLIYCIWYIIKISLNKEVSQDDSLIFAFCFVYFLACSIAIFRLLWFG